MSSNNILIVGAGLSGSVIARELAEKGFKVTIIEKRDHIAGNIYDFTNEHDIRIHKYGPHLFHTKNKSVFEWLSRFTEWVPYKHKVKAMLDDGRLVTLPVNKETKEIVGENNVIETFFRPYTEKMWGMKLEDISPNVVNRVPIRDDDNEYYFPEDDYQFVPKEGYTRMIENMLNHKNISIKLQVTFKKEMEDDYTHVFNSMPIDEYYDFCFGNLEYRSIKFHTLNIPVPKLFPTAVVNLTNSGPFTRLTEWKNIPGHGENDLWTTLTYEEPCSAIDEKYYPVKDLKNRNMDLLTRYKSMKKTNLTFIGRLGLYAYLDMDQAVNSGLMVVKNYINEKHT